MVTSEAYVLEALENLSGGWILLCSSTVVLVFHINPDWAKDRRTVFFCFFLLAKSE